MDDFRLWKETQETNKLVLKSLNHDFKHTNQCASI
jgi:hypothetical protein